MNYRMCVAASVVNVYTLHALDASQQAFMCGLMKNFIIFVISGSSMQYCLVRGLVAPKQVLPLNSTFF